MRATFPGKQPSRGADTATMATRFRAVHHRIAGWIEIEGSGRQRIYGVFSE